MIKRSCSQVAWECSRRFVWIRRPDGRAALERRGEEGGTYSINLATKVEVGARVRTDGDTTVVVRTPSPYTCTLDMTDTHEVSGLGGGMAGGGHRQHHLQMAFPNPSGQSLGRPGMALPPTPVITLRARELDGKVRSEHCVDYSQQVGCCSPSGWLDPWLGYVTQQLLVGRQAHRGILYPIHHAFHTVVAS